MIDGCITWETGQTSCGAKCTPIYEGDNCTCNGDDCTCQSWLFTDCAY